MTERTYSRADLEASRRAWSTFGPEWREVRRVAASRGMLYPPAGEPSDDREDPEPSQRAIVWQALEFRPRSTTAIVRRCRSWRQVVDQILGEESRIREDAGLAERDAEWDRSQRPKRREAAERIGDILARLR